MSVVEFWNALHEGGSVVVENDCAQPSRQEIELLGQAIQTIDSQSRLELAYDPPKLVLDVAVWAATTMHRSAQFLVYREIEAETVQQELKRPCPAAPSDEVCYSVDAALRILPQLLALARGVAPDDPLVLGLLKLAQDWPLSSVGVADLKDLDVRPFIEHPSLRRLYADRIIERRDVSRLTDARAVAAVREALGAHGQDIAPSIAGALEGSLDGSAKQSTY